MQGFIWGGTALAVLGLAGLVFCIVTVWRKRRSGADEAEMKATLQRVVAWNLAALLTSALGLMVLVVGVILG